MTFKCLPRAFLNIFSSKTDASPSEKKTAAAPDTDKVHVHGMWYQPSPQPRITSRDQHFREKLIAAYMGMANTATDLPPNAKAHLWTDRKSMHSLYMPVAKSNGSEIELPHSMLAKAPVSVHLDGEIEKLISQVSNKKLTAKLEKLLNNTAGENIGLRSDLARLLYGSLYSESAKKNKGKENTEINIHIDVDTLAATNMEKGAKQLGQDRVGNLDDMQRAKIHLLAMHQSLENMNFPEKSKPLSKEEVAVLAEQPQKSWSTFNPVEKPAEDPLAIPASLRKLGVVADSGENDVLGMIPHHKKAFKVAEKTLHVLETGKYKIKRGLPREIARAYKEHEKHVQEYAKFFHRLNGKEDIPESRTLDQKYVVDYFRLAEEIRKMKPALQEKMDALTRIAQDKTKSEQEQGIAKMKIDVLQSIYRASVRLTGSFVNKSSYFPQTETSTKKTSEKFQNFSNLVFGVKPPTAFTGSWKGGALDTDEINNYDRNSPQYKAQEKLVFADIKVMIRSRSTDDYEPL